MIYPNNVIYASIAGDQPGLKREIGHKPIRGLCQRLKGNIAVFYETLLSRCALTQCIR
jgi:hypothetical protein